MVSSSHRSWRALRVGYPGPRLQRRPEPHSRHRPEILSALHVMPGVPEFQLRRIHQEQTFQS